MSQQLETLLTNPTGKFLQACSLRDADLNNSDPAWNFDEWLKSLVKEILERTIENFQRWFREKRSHETENYIEQSKLNLLVKFLESIRARRIARVTELQAAWNAANLTTEGSPPVQ